jgi:hypothetical protein
LSAILVVVASAASAQADTIRLSAAQDTSLFSESLNSNARGGNLYTGRNNNGDTRRALVGFDASGQVPSGSTIQNAVLTLCLAGSADTDLQSREAAVHRILQAWGEGESNSGPGPGGGRGTAPTPGDATWLHREYSAATWQTPGGAYYLEPSATTEVGRFETLGGAGNGGGDGGIDSTTTDCQAVTFGSTPEMVADVERMLTSPAQGFGWLIRGDESINGTARRYYSREAGPAYEPFLTIDFTPPPPPPTVGDLTGNGVVDNADLAALMANYGMQSGATLALGDLNDDGSVGLRDLLIFRNAMTNSGATSALGVVPEPTTIVTALLAALAGGATWLIRRR